MRLVALSVLAFTIFGCDSGKTATDEAADDSSRHTGTDTDTDTDTDSGNDTDTSDADGDGVSRADGDCDDANATVYPGAVEACDGIDNDCDDAIDEAGNGHYYTDADGDGYGEGEPTAGCSPGAGYAAFAGDCNDRNAEVYPGATELCDRADNDCDSVIDEDVAELPWYLDLDEDGFGDPGARVDACAAPPGYVLDSSDCDDTKATVNPDGVELCNEIDDNCDFFVDNAAVDASSWFPDTDRDGYGDPLGATVEACDEPVGYSAESNDCDDTTSAVSPGATEVCNGVDDDCDGSIDEAAAYGTFYADADGDGYGDVTDTVTGCDAPPGYVVDGADCDDADADVHPTAFDTWYDGVDSDCDGASDYDFDADGYDYSLYGGTDCDDRNSAINPGTSDTPYDGLDADCSGISDYDADADGYDSDVYGGDDCDDTDDSVHPDAWESDETADHDCDGVLERGPVASADYDGTSSLESCAELALDGSGSYDADGSLSAYAWEITSVPSLSALATDDLDAKTDESPTVFVDVAGDYSFSLVVTDDEGNNSVVDTLDLAIAPRTSNSAPVADAGVDQSTSDDDSCYPVSYGASYVCVACSDYTFDLDGTGSTDADGEPLTYTWTVYSGSGTVQGSSTDPAVRVKVAGPTTTFGTTVTETVVVRLQTTDCYGATSAANSATLTYSCVSDGS